MTSRKPDKRKPRVVWTHESPGWYTSPLGGVCRENGFEYSGREHPAGWYFWPNGAGGPSGPYTSAVKARRAAERRRK